MLALGTAYTLVVPAGAPLHDALSDPGTSSSATPTVTPTPRPEVTPAPPGPVLATPAGAPVAVPRDHVRKIVQRGRADSVGNGVAIPHAYTDGVDRLVAGVYRTAAGIDRERSEE